MKKFMAMMITLSILISNSSVFAASVAWKAPGTPGLSALSAKRTIVTAGQVLPSQKKVPAKTWDADAKPQAALVLTNSKEISRLQSASNSSYIAAKARLKQLSKNMRSLTDKQLKDLKEASAALAKDKDLLGETIGDIDEETEKLNDAKAKKDLQAYKQALDNILEIQEARKEALRTIIEDLKRIAGM